MDKSSTYWDKRALNRLTDAEKISDVYIERIKNIYNQAHRNIDKEIANVYKNYAKNTGLDVQKLKELLSKKETDKTWKTLKRQGLDKYIKNNYKSRISRLEQIQAQIYAKAKLIYSKEELEQTMCYKGVINDTYYKAVYDTQMGTGFDFSFNKIDNNMTQALLSERWSGKNYSERIWGNTDVLADSLSEIVGGALLSGQSIEKTTKQIRDRFNVGKYYADRLVRTETNHFNNEADARAYEDMGIDKYVFVATLDSRTSLICQDHDGQVYKYSEREEGVDFPPLHPNCRSKTRGYLGEEVEKLLKRRAINPITGKTEIVDNIPYKEWCKKNDVDTNKNQSNKEKIKEISNKLSVINKKINDIQNSSGYFFGNYDEELLDRLLENKEQYDKEILDLKAIDDKSMIQDKEVRDFAYDYANGHYSTACTYTDKLVQGMSKQEAMDFTVKYEVGGTKSKEDVLNDISRTEKLVAELKKQDIIDYDLVRIQKTQYFDDGTHQRQYQVGENINWGIRSTSANTEFIDKIARGEDKITLSDPIRGKEYEITEFKIVGDKQVLDISKCSPYDQDERLIMGKFTVEKVENFEPTIVYDEKNISFQEYIKSNNYKYEFRTSKKGKEMLSIYDSDNNRIYDADIYHFIHSAEGTTYGNDYTVDDILNGNVAYKIEKTENKLKSTYGVKRQIVTLRQKKNDIPYDKLKNTVKSDTITPSNLVEKLNKNEEYAINKYIGSTSYTLNEKLREDIPLSEYESKIVDDLDSALNKLPKYQGNVTRSVWINQDDIDLFSKDYSVGNEVVMKAYTSTTIGDTYNPEASVQMYIKSKNARDITNINKEEQEILFERNSVFKVLKVNRRVDPYGTNYIDIFMEEL